MVYQLKAYGSVAELLGSVSTEIELAQRHMKEVRDASNEIRKRSDRAKRLQQAFLNGSRAPTPAVSHGIRVGDLDVVVNAGSDDQLLALDLMIHAQNERIVALQKIQDSLTKLQAKSPTELLNEISCLVIENDGVPRKVMFQDKSHYESEAMSSLFPSTMHGLNGAYHGPHPEHAKLGEVQVEMASIARDSTESRRSVGESDDSNDERRNPRSPETPHLNSENRLSSVLRFVTAKPFTPSSRP